MVEFNKTKLEIEAAIKAVKDAYNGINQVVDTLGGDPQVLKELEEKAIAQVVQTILQAKLDQAKTDLKAATNMTDKVALRAEIAMLKTWKLGAKHAPAVAKFGRAAGKSVQEGATELIEQFTDYVEGKSTPSRRSRSSAPPRAGRHAHASGSRPSSPTRTFDSPIRRIFRANISSDRDDRER